MQVKRFFSIGLLLTIVTLWVPILGDCTFETGQYRSELSDINTITKLNVEIAKSRKWAKNGINIVSSRENFIKKKYKKKYKATVTVTYPFGDCAYSAEVRQSGDFKDHISFKKGAIFQSLDVSLEQGNIANVTRFKLLIPRTRHLIYELMGANLLSAMGYLSPRTGYVKVTQNGVPGPMIFQETPSKELLERNHRREGPIFEGDEAFIWDWGSYENFELSSISLARIINKNWVEKGPSSLMIALSSLSMVQAMYMDHAENDGNSEETEKKTVLDFRYFANKSSKAWDFFVEYDLFLIASKGTHALRAHNRKFYWNELNSTLEPIYYDGGFLPERFNSFYDTNNLKTDNDMAMYQEMVKPRHIHSLLQKLAAIDRESFAHTLSLSLDKEAALEETNKFMSRIEKNLKIILSEIKDPQEDIDSIAGLPSLLSKQTLAEHYKTRYFNFLPNGQTVYVKSVAPDAKYAVVETCDKNHCVTERMALPELITIMRGKKSPEKPIVFIGSDTTHKRQTDITSLAALGLDIRHTKGASVSYDAATRHVYLKQGAGEDWFLIKQAKLDNVTIELQGMPALSATPPDDSQQRFNDYGLTGCLTFYDVQFNDAKIIASKGECEDSVNIVRGTGSIKNMVIHKAYADAFDADFSTLTLRQVTVKDAGNDCIDVSSGDYNITDARVTNCNDKGVSVGEGSIVKADHIVIQSAFLGISSKDSSMATIDIMEGRDIDITLQAYRKKEEFFGGSVVVNNGEFDTFKYKKDRDSIVILEGVAL